MAKHISDKIHGIGTDVYSELTLVQKDLQGWASTGRSFDEVIKLLKPKTIIEVGTWKGASAVNMAKLALAEGIPELELEIVCIDTFLGSYEHYCTMGTFDLLETRINGLPQIYNKFLSNVLQENLQNVITPFAIDSGNGALALKHWGVKADLIYIDAAHDYDFVKIDFSRYSEVLRDGGYLLIDDWHHGPIKNAATEVFGDKVFDFHGKAAWIKQ